MVSVRNAWIVVEPQTQTEALSFPDNTIALRGSPHLFSAIAHGDWILVTTPDGDFVRTGQVLRLRTETNGTIVYFDRVLV